MGGYGWGDLGYHYLIDQWGQIWQGRPLDYKGAHVEGDNFGNLGVCFLTNGSQHSLTKEAMNSAVALSAWWVLSFPLILVDNIKGHRDWMATECPGNFIYSQLPEIRRRVKALLAEG